MRLRTRATISGMSKGYDYRAEAEAAIKKAAAATCEHDRLQWLRVAQAWHDLPGGMLRTPEARKGNAQLSHIQIISIGS
jgi:hypothetical protein